VYTVYVLRSLKDKRTYVGCTNDIKRRLQDHNTGQVQSTKYRIPFKLVYKEEYINRTVAFKREEHLKTSWGRRQLRKILAPLID